MAKVIALNHGEEPWEHERYAQVVVSPKPPKEGAALDPSGFGETFFADDGEHDVSVIVGRAKLWADKNIVARVYVRLDAH
jgi:hypothetical protein